MGKGRNNEKKIRKFGESILSEISQNIQHWWNILKAKHLEIKYWIIFCGVQGEVFRRKYTDTSNWLQNAPKNKMGRWIDERQCL